ncbi:hybrid sensor histidine kinase/response regulator [Kordiimonas aquimaris]|uniref:hybrid sensor histidine kinase/response regulator n=1 Tax=Kordiimonas aquimaris TaxID=707591 RepID=UPI0021D23A0A|nr:hybrid sensor histidine kinase/response regulator [Kordiimonas aquimaris]
MSRPKANKPSDKLHDQASASIPLADMVFDTLNIAAAALDEDGCYITVNNDWAILFGSPDGGSWVGKSHFEECKAIFSESEFADVLAGSALREQLAQIRGNTIESTSSSDSELALYWNALPIKEAKVACVVTARRVEDAVDEVKQLIRDRDQLRFAIEGADYGLWDWDVVTGEVYFSRQYMNIVGYEQFELPHTYDTWSILCRPEDLLDAEQAVKDYQSVGDGFLEDEFQMIHKNGTLVWILSRGKIVSWREDGSPRRIVGTHQDISAKKEREAALVKAKEEAVKANQAKSDFLALISHEIRTPLNGITSVLQLLADEDDADERGRLSQIALNSSDQLLTVLSDVLDVSKMEAGRFDLNPQSINLVNLVEELSQTHKKAIEAKGLSFNLTVNGNAQLQLMMDPVRVTQIMNNFLSNAAKFTEKGAVALTVDIDESYTSDASGKVYLSFAVRDDGVGLSPSERERLFQPFYQAEGTRSRSSEGTGLGLSICKKLAGLMGGKVWCASKKGAGSTFYFEAAFPVADTNTNRDHDIIEDTNDVRRENIRVLAAEDNPVNQMMLKKFLVERMGYPVVVVGDGAQALEALSKDVYDVVLMDIHMPVKDGVTATRELRAMDETWCRLPIIALTADTTQVHMDEYSEAGIDACVSKPVDWQKLDATIQEVVRQKVSKPITH